jgi:hypothetical protein
VLNWGVLHVAYAVNPHPVLWVVLDKVEVHEVVVHFGITATVQPFGQFLVIEVRNRRCDSK